MDIRYVAGLFDGEGYIRIATFKQSKLHTRMQLFGGIGMTYLPVIQQLQERFGGSVQCNDHSRRNAAHRPQHFWLVSSVKAANFLKSVVPHLIVKREEALLAIEFQNSIDEWRGKLGNRSPKSFTTEREAVWAYRRDLARRISELKHIRHEPQ